jgi:transcriptional regulator with XRE-family HTH domain
MDSRGISQKLDEKTLNAVLMKVTDNVRKHRKLQGLSQLNLSYAMGFDSAGMVSFVEAGINNRRYNIEHIATIARILSIPVGSLFDGVDEIINISLK